MSSLSRQLLRSNSARLVAGLWMITAFSLYAKVVHSEDLTCLKSEQKQDTESTVTPTWYEVLRQEATTRLAERAAAVDQLKTDAQIREYQKTIQQVMRQQLGEFPERCALNSQLVGQLQGVGYRIEKVLFESQPRHHIAVNVYVPEGTGPFPAVVISSGHSRTGKTADYNQRYGIRIAEQGMIAACFDPIGQGERSQELTAEGKPKFEGTTTEHFHVGAGSILVGRNTATYSIWDAMRVVDYLVSRSDVRADRIGMAGCSGGGTLTSYTMALDDRIKCAAPSCYLTTFSRLLEVAGPQDAEQNIFGQLKMGLDQTDYVLMRAPKPTLISSTTEDFFDIRGSWENFRENKRIYTRLGASASVELVEADGKHGVQPANLAASVQWFKRWLLEDDKPVAIKAFADFKTFAETDLWCTPRGQVLLMNDERSVYDLNAEYASEKLRAKRIEAWKKLSKEERSKKIQTTIGFDPLPDDFHPTSNKAGKVERDGYHIDKLVIHGRTRVPLPALTFHPPAPDEDAILYLHDSGKVGDSQPGGPIETYIKDNKVVVSVDLRGQGETASGKADAQLGDWRTFYMAYLMGQSTVGAHVEDILTAAKWTAHYQTKKPREVHLVAVGKTSVAALHVASLYPELFASVTIKDGISSWTEMASKSELATGLTATVHNVLAVYDLPDLVELMPASLLR